MYPIPTASCTSTTTHATTYYLLPTSYYLLVYRASIFLLLLPLHSTSLLGANSLVYLILGLSILLLPLILPTETI
ncbi:hypothetical protein V8C37DRAFT_388984, partial [Trichoderma ceciliae]